MLVAETFLPAVNGVVNSVLHVAGELADRGHQPVVVAPSGSTIVSPAGHRIDVIRVPSMSLPGYPGLRVGRPGLDLRPLVRDLDPDILHLASPALLGWSAVCAAGDLSIPVVAAFQTDLSAYLRRYRLGAGSALLWGAIRRLHNRADLTLVPSSATRYQLGRHGIGPLATWSRGVDADLFHPKRRDRTLHRMLAGGAGKRLLVGYVGRLAAEKRVDLLEPLTHVPDVRLVIVGDGPRQAALARAMPEARFLGRRGHDDLARIMASLDVLVHPGGAETFCQVIQEALSSGVPVVTAARGGPLDLVRHGENGWLWAGDDPRELAALVVSIREDQTQLAAMRSRARASVAGRSWQRATDQVLVHYDNVLSSRRQASGALAGGLRLLRPTPAGADLSG